MKILICGGTGLIGLSLTKYWLKQGHHVTVVTRSPTKTQLNNTYSDLDIISWSQLFHCPTQLENVDVVINLAGQSINQRWTKKTKKKILFSRLEATQKIYNWARNLPHPLPVYISASGISIYGPSETATFDETTAVYPNDFLSNVVYQWEAAADLIPCQRCVKLRIAPVLSNNGGIYPQIMLPYLFGVGGRIGTGKQPFSWIHQYDMVRLIDFVIHNPISGIINACSPETVTNDEFGRAIANIYQKKHWLPIPSWVIKLCFGEMSTLLLNGQRVYPAKALEHSFIFYYGSFKKALLELYHSKSLKS